MSLLSPQILAAIMMIGVTACRAERPSPTPEPTPSAPATTPSRPESWTPLGSGLELRRWHVPSLGDLHVARAEPKRWQLSWARASESEGDAALSTVDRMAHDPPARVAVNGGFFDQAGLPLGLRVAGGSVRNKLHKADWGVFFVREGVPNQVHTRDAKKAAGAEFAIQCGPRLVQDGKPFKLKASVHRRTVIGCDAASRVYLAVTVGFVDLNALAEALAAPVAHGGLGLAHALNLDGGPSTAMFVDGADGAWNVPGGTAVSDAVLLIPRDNKANR